LVSATAAAIHGYFGLTADVIQPLCELRESHPVITAICTKAISNIRESFR